MAFLDRYLTNHVLTLTMTSPETRNALTGPEQFDDIVDVCREINDNMAIRAVVLTGEGSAFCAGGNVKDMRDRTGMFSGDPMDQADAYRKGIQRIPRAIYSLNVPIIAAVNGPAVGAGCDLATMCDIRIASRNAMFAESFAKLGLIPGDGGAWFLPRVVGYSNACLMAFAGEPVKAEAALHMGLVSEVVEPEVLVELLPIRRMPCGSPSSLCVRVRMRRWMNCWISRQAIRRSVIPSLIITRQLKPFLKSARVIIAVISAELRAVNRAI